MLGNPENDLLIGNGNRLLPSGATTAPYVGYISQADSFQRIQCGRMNSLLTSLS